MAVRSCVSMGLSSNGGGLRGQKGKTSADVGEFNGLPMTQSADLPVRPFGVRPAEPAFATGAPPDASGATPARALLARSEEHTSELQSQFHLVCRLLLEKKKILIVHAI